MNKQMKIFVVILSILLALFAYNFGLPFVTLGQESDFFVPIVTGDNISTYKNSCSEINLTDLSKDYKALNGKNVKITGQLCEKIEYFDFQFGNTRSNNIIKVPGISPEFMVITYNGTIPYNINDTITVYGEYYYPVSGFHSPPEIANKNLTSIKAGYIEKSWPKTMKIVFKIGWWFLILFYFFDYLNL